MLPMKKRNLLIIKGNAFIPLGVSAQGGFACIDLEDVERAEKHNWVFDGVYAASHINGRKVRLHSFIVPAVKGRVIDHANNNKMDNRKSNLRQVKHSTNIRNQGKAKGVCWSTRDRIWEAYIGVDRQKISLGFFKDKGEAMRARKAALRKYRNV